MILILDTHAFLWWASGSPKLSKMARSAIEDTDNTVYLSVASVWEIVIKVNTDKLKLDESLETMVATHCEKSGFQLLPIDLSHVYQLQSLPNHHRDPFDRILVAQALTEGAMLITVDPLVTQYPVPILW